MPYQICVQHFHNLDIKVHCLEQKYCHLEHLDIDILHQLINTQKEQ